RHRARSPARPQLALARAPGPGRRPRLQRLAGAIRLVAAAPAQGGLGRGQVAETAMALAAGPVALIRREGWRTGLHQACRCDRGMSPPGSGNLLARLLRYRTVYRPAPSYQGGLALRRRIS